AVGQERGGGPPPEPGGPGRRRPEVPHRLPAGVRDAAGHLAGVRQQGRARGEVGGGAGAAGEELTATFLVPTRSVGTRKCRGGRQGIESRQDLLPGPL